MLFQYTDVLLAIWYDCHHYMHIICHYYHQESRYAIIYTWRLLLMLWAAPPARLIRQITQAANRMRRPSLAPIINSSFPQDQSSSSSSSCHPGAPAERNYGSAFLSCV